MKLLQHVERLLLIWNNAAIFWSGRTEDVSSDPFSADFITNSCDNTTHTTKDH